MGVFHLVMLHVNVFFSQHGRYIETITVVIDFENLCLKRHYYWPGIETLKEVSVLFLAIL